MDHDSVLHSLPTSSHYESVVTEPNISLPDSRSPSRLGTAEYLEEELADISASDEDESISDISESSMEEIFCPLFTFPTPPPCQRHTTELITSATQIMTITPFTPHPRPVISAPRHAYPHHGHSRSSLMHMKWFWHSRHTDWQSWDARVTNQAYDGIDDKLETPADDYQMTNDFPFSPVQPMCQNIIPNSIATSHCPKILGETALDTSRKFFFAADHGEDDHDAEGDGYEITTVANPQGDQD
jgi:hypothetical protein